MRIFFKTISIILICLMLSCEENDELIEKEVSIIGSWKELGVQTMFDTFIYTAEENKIRLKFTADGIRIKYDPNENITSKCNYSINDSTIILYGYNELIGEVWMLSEEYWFNHDTLVLHFDGGWEYYNLLFTKY